MTTIHFSPNVPEILTLSDVTGDLEGYNVLYPTSDGKTLSLPRPAAVKLNMLDPEPGEEISITKYRTDPKQPAEWVVALTARSEQARAQREAEKLAELDIGRQLQESIRATRPVRQIPKSAGFPPSEAPESPRGTGTYGSMVQTAPAGRKPKAEAVPFNVAFVEVTRFVVDGLKSVGEQWNDQAKQDAICSVLISASRQGLLSLWERQA